jgi:hypothetical protein
MALTIEQLTGVPSIATLSEYMRLVRRPEPLYSSLALAGITARLRDETLMAMPKLSLLLEGVETASSGLSKSVTSYSTFQAPDQVTLSQIWRGIDSTVKEEIAERYKGIPHDFVIFRRLNVDAWGALYHAPMWVFGEKILRHLNPWLRYRSANIPPIHINETDTEEYHQAITRRMINEDTSLGFGVGRIWLCRVVDGTPIDELTNLHYESRKIYWVRVGPMEFHGKPKNAIAFIHGVSLPAIGKRT